ncbi:catechol 1,2-dioxygenase, partial [Corynebacterium freneyi]
MSQIDLNPTAHDSGNKATDKFKAERVTADTSQ